MVPHLLKLRTIHDPRGNLSVFEKISDDFGEIKSMRWLTHFPPAFSQTDISFDRGKHFFIPLSGSFIIHDNVQDAELFLNHPAEGVLIPSKCSFSISGFSAHSICLVLSNTDKVEGNGIEFLEKESFNDQSQLDENGFIRIPCFRESFPSVYRVKSRKDIDFPISRVYFLYDIPGGASRGGHAHKKLEQLLIAASGSFDVWLDNGKEKKVIRMNRPDQALAVNTMTWREIHNFSSGACCLVLASKHFEEEDYYREYKEFLENA